MSAAALSPAEVEALTKLAPDLRFILSEQKVPEALQAQLSMAGFRSIGLFDSMVDSRGDLRAVLIGEFGTNPAELNLAPGEAMDEGEVGADPPWRGRQPGGAERRRSRGRDRPRRWHPSPSNSLQHRSAVGVRGASIQDQAAGNHLSPGGLRACLKALARHVCTRGLAGPPDYILKDKVGTFVVKMDDVEVRAPWSIVLSYGFQVCQTAGRVGRFDNMDFRQARAAARHCRETKEPHFSTPTGCRSAWRSHRRPSGSGQKLRRKRTRSTSRRAAPRTRTRHPRAPRPRGAAVRARPRGLPAYPHNRTPDRRNICFCFQTGACSTPSCALVHVCAQPALPQRQAQQVQATDSQPPPPGSTHRWRHRQAGRESP